MKLDLRDGTTARQLADLHQRLGDAHQALIAAATSQAYPAPRCPLRVSSQTTVVSMARRIGRAMYALEGRLMRVTRDDKAPFANPSNPRAWHEWLDKHETS